MSLAHAVSWRAGCLGTPVGAVLVKKNRVLATGFNGTPEGLPNCDEGGGKRCETKRDARVEGEQSKLETEGGKNLDVCVCVHAETNVLTTAARFGVPVEGAEMYVTDMPCMQCAKSMVQAGISRVTYSRYFGVAQPDSNIGRNALSDEHQLMRELKARKLMHTNVAKDLSEWLEWLLDEKNSKYSLNPPMQRTPLEDDQFDTSTIEFNSQPAR